MVRVDPDLVKSSQNELCRLQQSIKYSIVACYVMFNEQPLPAPTFAFENNFCLRQ